MDPSPRPRQELALAEAAMEGMRASRSFEEFERHWREFLRRLDRAWNKAQDHYIRHPRWHSWGGRFARQRTTDPMLCYLVQARNVDEHTVSDVMQHEPGATLVRAGPGGGLHIKSMTINQGRIEHLSYTGAAPTIEFVPSRPKLLPVTSRGRTYQPPTSHLDAAVNPADVLGIARRGLAYYAKFIDDAEANFAK